MKILLTIIATFLATIISAQTKTFTLLDTNVTTGIYTTRQIQFDLAKPTVRPESYIILDSIALFMDRNKKVIVEVGVHADNRARNTSGVMTMYRATSIVDYLIKKGISADRLVSKGYGSVKPLVSEATINKAKTKDEKEALHAFNRRVTLKILGLTSGN